jgi:uncharacterized protein YggL (DUF469 family)
MKHKFSKKMHKKIKIDCYSEVGILINARKKK